MIEPTSGSARGSLDVVPPPVSRDDPSDRQQEIVVSLSFAQPPAARRVLAVLAALLLVGAFASFAGPNSAGAANGTNVVKIEFLACPAGTNLNAPYSTLHEKCTGAKKGVVYSLVNFKPRAQGQRLATTLSGDGSTVRFLDVPSGDFTIREIIPAGFSAPVAFCAGPGFPNPDAPAPLTVINGRADLKVHLDGFEAIVCDYFHVPS
jgi:hypothetical protein